MDLSFSNIIGGVIFSGVGFVAFTYGKRKGSFKMMGMGALMMTYCMFTPALWTYLIGAGLTGLLYYRREWFND